jgi:2-dehydro-3-deoxyphosphogluconate aldolase/(4S)-4-hydroxy-2-oxoglutarate aldolase
MPAMQREVVAYCVNNNIPVFPGAFTPLEIHNAWTAGATMVKVFPSQFFGPAYFKALKGPFDKIKLMACGGVNQSTIKDYFSNGADAVAFGASIFKKELIAKKDFISIENNIKSFLSALDCCTG